MPARLSGPRRERTAAEDEADRAARERERDEHRGEQHPELVSGGDPFGERDVVGGECVLGEVPGDHHERPERADAEHRRPAQAQRDKAQPQRQPEHQRRERAARVGEQQRHQHQPHRGVGECAQQRVPGAAGAQPHAADRADRGGQADRVPIAVRRLQPCVDVPIVLCDADRVGEDLGEQRIAAHDHCGQQHPPEHRRPLRGGSAREQHGEREHGAVGEQAPGVLPAGVGLNRPDRRQRR